MVIDKDLKTSLEGLSALTSETFFNYTRHIKCVHRSLNFGIKIIGIVDLGYSVLYFNRHDGIIRVLPIDEILEFFIEVPF